MNPYRTSMPPRDSGVVFVGSLDSPRIGVPVGIPAALTALTIVLLCAILNSGCAWFQRNEAYFPTPADLACVATAVENGTTDPAQVVAACPHLAMLALEDLLALISGQMAAKEMRRKPAAAAPNACDAGSDGAAK